MAKGICSVTVFSELASLSACWPFHRSFTGPSMDDTMHKLRDGGVNVTPEPVESELTVPQIAEGEFVKETSELDQRDQRSLANSVLLVLTVTFAMIVNVRTPLILFLTFDFLMSPFLVSHSACECHSFLYSTTYHSKRNAPTGSATTMDCICVSSQFRESLLPLCKALGCRCFDFLLITKITTLGLPPACLR